LAVKNVKKMKKQIYLRDDGFNWKLYEFENTDDFELALKSRDIIIHSNCEVSKSYIGNGSAVLNGSTVLNGSAVLNGSTVDGSTVNGSRVLNGSTVNGSTVLNGSTVDGSTVDGSTVDGSTVLNGSTVDGSRVDGSTVNGSTVNGSTVLNGSRVDGSTVNGSTVNGSTVLNGEITKYTAMFAVNLYLYSTSAYLNKEGNEVIQLGCFTRFRSEWESNFWNNDKEFPNNGSDKSKARLRAFNTACFFLDSIKKEVSV
jgi:carbonic anhydrase/acetyltransferase-like protein (isoleucine patch superfamily)